MNINIVGDGSAGRRHESMLRARGHICTVLGLENTHPAGHPACDAVVIASPPDTHERYIRHYWGRSPILCEGPVTLAYHVNMLPHMYAGNWLFVPQVQALQERCQAKRPTHAHLWFDFDLAKWRPGVDYMQTCYYTSGIDLINHHEAAIALYLFGPALHVSVYKTHSGKSAAVDTLTMNIKHVNGCLTTVNSSWHAARYNRGIRVFFQDGTMEETGWVSPGDDGTCNSSYGAMLDHWLHAIAVNDLDVRPSMYDGFRAFRLLQGEAV